MAVASSNHFVFPWEKKKPIFSPETNMLSPDGVANAPFSGSPIAHAEKNVAGVLKENIENDGELINTANRDLDALFKTFDEGEGIEEANMKSGGSLNGSMLMLEQEVEAAVASSDSNALNNLLQKTERLIASSPTKELDTESIAPEADSKKDAASEAVPMKQWRDRREDEDDWEWARRLRHADEAKVLKRLSLRFFVTS
jgi:hypothetical protein